MPKLVPVLVLAGLLGLIGAVAVNAATPAQVVRRHQQKATGAADQLLADLVLPADATQVPTEPKGDNNQLEHPSELFIFAATVDLHRFWTTAASPSAVIASIDAHLPPGAKSTGSGYSGPTSQFVSYSLPTIDAPALGPRALTIEAVTVAGGRTGVRADAAVRYSAPRVRAQQVPAAARVLQVTIANYRAKPQLSLTVTNRATVRRIAAVVNKLPFAAALRGIAISCPAILSAPTDTFTFRASPTGPALATVSEPANNPSVAEPCFTTSFKIGTRREPGLLEGGVLLRRAGAILGVKLTRRGT